MVWCVVVELHSLKLIQPSTPDPVQLYNMIDPGDELTCVLCGACICIVVRVKYVCIHQHLRSLTVLFRISLSCFDRACVLLFSNPSHGTNTQYDGAVF